jgi:nucleotide-binding universal stress UspA family protein
MADWKKICCTIDFSGPSRFAMEKAADLAKRLQADLTLLHVNEAAVAASDETGLSAAHLLEEAARGSGRRWRTGIAGRSWPWVARSGRR